MLNTYSPTQLAELVSTVSVREAGSLVHTIGPIGTRLSAEHARELLSLARRLTEWHKIVAVLMIGDFFFENEFVDFGIDMLSFPPSERPCSTGELLSYVERDEDPWAVGLWACNLLMSRKTISSAQYRRISGLPAGTFGKQTLLDALKSRVV